MLLSFDATVSAVTYSIIEERVDKRENPRTILYNRVTCFVLEQHARMPDYLKLPIRALTLVLDASAIPASRKPLHCLAHAQRWHQIEAWKSSRITLKRDLIKFYESLAIFGWHSEIHENLGS